MRRQNALALFRTIMIFMVVAVSFCGELVSVGRAEEAFDAETAGVEADLAFLPTMFYRGADETIGFNLCNPRDAELTVMCEFQVGSSRRLQTVRLAANETRLVPFAFNVPSQGSLPRQAWFRVREYHGEGENKESVEVLSTSVMIRSNLEGVTDIDVVGTRLYDAKGRPVVLAIDQKSASSARRWLPLRLLKQRVPLLNRPVFFFAPRRVFDFVQADEAYGRVRTFTHVPYDGDPLRACLAIPESIPSDIPVTVVVAWGLDEGLNRYDRRLFERALDTLLERLNAWNPQMRLIVLVPPPYPGHVPVAEVYADSVRRIARSHQVRRVDWFAAIVFDPDWERHYSLDDDSQVLSELPRGLSAELIRMFLRAL